ncbi:hypothetical protein GCM10008941_33400 [Rhizomicrobium palustre]
MYDEAGVDFEPRWYGLFTLLRHAEDLDIGSAAAVLGQSHVAVVQVANALEKRGLIRRVTARHDKRSRVLQMTAKGRALCEKLDPLWDAVSAASAALLKEAAPSLLADLEALDAALLKRPMLDRIQHHLQDNS